MFSEASHFSRATAHSVKQFILLISHPHSVHSASGPLNPVPRLPPPGAPPPPGAAPPSLPAPLEASGRGSVFSDRPLLVMEMLLAPAVPLRDRHPPPLHRRRGGGDVDGPLTGYPYPPEEDRSIDWGGAEQALPVRRPGLATRS